MRRFFLAVTLAAVAAAGAAQSAMRWKVPPLDGDLAGEIKSLWFGGSPPLKWEIHVQTPRPRERVVSFAARGPGAVLRGEARLDPAGEGSWRIAEAEFDLAQWFSPLAAQHVPALATVAASGKLSVVGEGTWRGGKLGGAATLSLREGRIDDPQHKLLLDGISVDVEIADLARLRTAPAQVFTWRSGRYDVVPLGVGRIEFAVADEQVRVTSSLIDVFGGELQVGSLVMSTKRLEFSVDARMDGIAVEQILFLLPPVLSEARGRLDGNVALKRDATGVQIGDSRLKLREGETADLRLAVRPGWLSTSLPPPVLRYFPGFQKIENGQIPLRARDLEITLTPAGDEQGRTGWVHIVGGPTDPELTAPLDLTINIRGSLDALVKLGAELGTDSRLRFSGAR